MSESVWIGLGLTLLAGLGSGNCMLPLKFARRWKWENLWLIFTLVSLVVIPWLLALFLVPRLGSVYGSTGLGQMTLPFLLGAGWGIAQILFGLSVARLGLALAYAVIIGLGSLGGTLVPLIFNNRGVLTTPRGALILVGLAVMVAGIAVSARAGAQREQGIPRAHSSGYTTALALAILCGLMAPMINYAFAFGQAIANRAVDLGATPVQAAYAVWPIALAGGLLPNLFYSIFLLCKNGTWDLFREASTRDCSLAMSMGILWMGAVAVYGVASVYLGSLGTSVGWGLFQIFMIITANCGGLLAGEWRSASTAARTQLYAGLALLIVATLLLAAANR
jgi:multidrug transporter EmrE-like cation transporter